jgi:hypothetical protein
MPPVQAMPVQANDIAISLTSASPREPRPAAARAPAAGPASAARLIARRPGPRRRGALTSRPEHVARQTTTGTAGPRPASTTRSRAGSPHARQSAGAVARRPRARSAPRPPDLSRTQGQRGAGQGTRGIPQRIRLWEALRGKPLYSRITDPFRPRHHILGSDIAGQVEAPGRDATLFQPGEDVLADILGRMGGFAEYVCVPESALGQCRPA